MKKIKATKNKKKGENRKKKKKKYACRASRRCLANNLPVLISAAGPGELAL